MPATTKEHDAMASATDTPTPKKRAAIRKPTGKKTAGNLMGTAAAPPAAASDLPLELVEPGHFTNPRGPVDTASPAFQLFLENVREHGVLQPILVGPALPEGGRHPIIAGWTRYAAAVAAGMPAIPVRQVALTEARDALVAGLAENVARDDMSPLAEARAIDTLMREHGYTQVAAGKAIGMAERTVRERVRLLKIHTAAPAVGEAIDRGEIPMDAAVNMQQIADVSPAIAHAILELVNTDERIAPGDLARPALIANVLEELSEARPGLLVALSGTLSFERLPFSDAQLKRLGPISKAGDVSLYSHLEESERIELVKSGATIAFSFTNSWNQNQTKAYIVAGPVLDELLERKLQDLETRAEKAAAARIKREKAYAAQSGKTPAGALSEKEKAEMQAARAKAAQAVDQAHHRNVLLGQRGTLDVFAGQALTLPAAQMVALLALDAQTGQKLVARGGRYCDPEHLTETVKKDGSVKRRYAKHNGPTGLTELRDLVLAATTPEAALAPVLRAFALATQASELVVTESDRAFFSLPRGDRMAQIPELISEVVGATGILNGITEEAAALARRPAPPVESPTVSAAAPALKSAKARSDAALKLIREKPGITIPDLAEGLGIKQNYLYRILPDLQKDGHVRKEGRGWHATTDAGATS